MNRTIGSLMVAWALIALAACGGTANKLSAAHAPSASTPEIGGPTAVATPTVPATPTAVATPTVLATPTGCDSRVATWAQDGGTSQDQTVMGDIQNLRTAIGNAASATDPGIVNASAGLAADAKSAVANSPPKCSGLYYRYLEGMAALALGATDVEYGSDINGTDLLTKGIHKLTPVLRRINRDIKAAGG